MKREEVFALLMLMAITLLPSCASTTGPTGAQPRTPAYADGYSDGCVSGQAAQGSVSDRERKNANRFASDEQYAKGWSDAYRKCADEQMQKMAAGSL